MQVPQIQIQQTYAKIGMESRFAKLQIKQPMADINIHQEHVKVEIDSEPAKVLIDQSKAWDALGIIPPIVLTKRAVEQAKQIALDGVARRAEDGDRLAAIQNKEDPIPELAGERVFSHSGIDYFGTPSSLNVEFDVIPHSLNINWKGGTVEIDNTPRYPIIDYVPGQLDVYLRQKNSIKIHVPKVDMTI